MSTTAQLVGRVRIKAGQSSVQGVTQEVIVAHLNRAQEFLIWNLPVGAMPEVCETATGSLVASRATLPSDLVFERSVRVGNPLVKCLPQPVSMLDELVHNPWKAPSATQPYYFIWMNADDDSVKVHIELGAPTSTAAYEIRYVKMPADLAMSASDPVWSERFCDLLVLFATMRLREAERNFPERNRLWGQLEERVAVLRSRYQPKQRSEGTPSYM